MSEPVRNDVIPPDPGVAAAALAHADQAKAAVRARSGWTARYLRAYGLASVVFVLVVSLPGRAGGSVPVVAALVVSALWAAFVALACVYSHRQAVTWRGFARVNGLVFGTWGALWAAASGIGFSAFPGRLAFWLPAALVVSLPFFVGARVAARR